jgi:hypothetical protein
LIISFFLEILDNHSIFSVIWGRQAVASGTTMFVGYTPCYILVYEPAVPSKDGFHSWSSRYHNGSLWRGRRVPFIPGLEFLRLPRHLSLTFAYTSFLDHHIHSLAFFSNIVSFFPPSQRDLTFEGRDFLLLETVLTERVHLPQQRKGI